MLLEFEPSHELHWVLDKTVHWALFGGDLPFPSPIVAAEESVFEFADLVEILLVLLVLLLLVLTLDLSEVVEVLVF